MKSIELKPKLINKWVQFVKQYAIDNNISYSSALKEPLCKATYLTMKNN